MKSAQEMNKLAIDNRDQMVAEAVAKALPGIEECLQRVARTGGLETTIVWERVDLPVNPNTILIVRERIISSLREHGYEVSNVDHTRCMVRWAPQD